MGEKQPQGKESHQREQEVSEAEMDGKTKHTNEEKWCTTSCCKRAQTFSTVHPNVKSEGMDLFP